jgi:hypothetical protein
MRLLAITVVASMLSCAFALSACQSILSPNRDELSRAGDDVNAASSKPQSATVDAASPLGCLAQAGLVFDNADCTKCMSESASCCAATTACFVGNAECTALHACISGCKGGEDGGAPLPDAGTIDGGAGSGLSIFTSSVYPMLAATCADCHASGKNGAPIFFGADATATYPLFKARGFQLPNSLLLTKGAHLGPALTAQERSSIESWVDAEVRSGGLGPCKDACTAQHPSAVGAWQTYNTCTVETCKATCL